MILINSLLIIMFLITAFTVIYNFIFSVAGLFSFKKQFRSNDNYKKIAVFIHSYHRDRSILQAAEMALFQSYPSHRYDVIVIGDSLKPATISALKKLPLIFIESYYDISNKAKALNTAFQHLKNHYDIAVILDDDNTMKADFLEKVNAAFNNGCYAVQGHKISRQDKSSVGILESMSSEINNHIFRKGHQALKLSSAVIGSGIAFSYEYLKLVVAEMEMQKGFDKELELALVEDNHRIIYLDDAIIVDENNQDEERFTHQRADWIRNQFTYFKHHVLRGFLSVFFGKFDYANKIAHFALVPKAILLCFLLLITGITSLDVEGLVFGFKEWSSLTLLYITALVIAVPLRFYKLSTLIAIATLPWSLILIFKEIATNKQSAKATVSSGTSVNLEKQTH